MLIFAPTKERHMKLIETMVMESEVYVRYADDANPEKATQWLDFQLPLSELKHPNNQHQKLLSIDKLERHTLGNIRLSAIMRIQEFLQQQEAAVRSALNP
jgi:hypothetical protein